jgi:hypothetical protein
MLAGYKSTGLAGRLGLRASFTGAVIAIFIAVFEVQGWEMPALIAVPLLVVLGLMILVALATIVYEVVKEVIHIREHLATSPSWVSSEEPGLLDYEADGVRAMNRFTKEIEGLGRDSGRLGKELTQHTKRFQEPGLGAKPQEKQRRANQAAKSIDRRAVYIEKRKALLEALVKDIFRNYNGVVATASIDTPEDLAQGRDLADKLEAMREITGTAAEQVAGFRDSSRNLQEMNHSRTMRIASKRLADGLDSVVKLLRGHRDKTGQLHHQLTRRLATQSTAGMATSQHQPTS